ncbi:hypothetical protein PN456_17065 [Nodularia spumigena CS-586/05]|uniref:hypothetical protein n=1 Tax=Nodularia spumigena TaxID=70799 RepID=UPI00232DD86C|nr:hypothetical protein [Nodularia spumigena]MDB9370637.1 hypothetical protein [Nodularia spumigena CS-586/05]
MQLLDYELEQSKLGFTGESRTKEWDEIDLSTPENRKELMEVLICQKAKRGEDITQCLKVLDYLKTQTEENKLYDILAQEVKERSVFNSLQRVCITSFAILGMIAFSHGVLSRSENPTISNSVERNQFFSEGDANGRRSDAFSTRRSANGDRSDRKNQLPSFESGKPDGKSNNYRTDSDRNGNIQGQQNSTTRLVSTKPTKSC